MHFYNFHTSSKVINYLLELLKSLNHVLNVSDMETEMNRKWNLSIKLENSNQKKNKQKKIPNPLTAKKKKIIFHYLTMNTRSLNGGNLSVKIHDSYNSAIDVTTLPTDLTDKALS